METLQPNNEHGTQATTEDGDDDVESTNATKPPQPPATSLQAGLEAMLQDPPMIKEPPAVTPPVQAITAQENPMDPPTWPLHPTPQCQHSRMWQCKARTSCLQTGYSPTSTGTISELMMAPNSMGKYQTITFGSCTGNEQLNWRQSTTRFQKGK